MRNPLRRPSILAATALAVGVAGTLALATEREQRTARTPAPDAVGNEETHSRQNPLPLMPDGIPTFNVTMTPSNPGGPPSEGGVAGGDCAPQLRTYSALDFNCQGGCAVIAQAGMVENEVAAASFAIPADEFPIIVRTVELVWAQNHTNETETVYSIIVWDGPPNTGAIEDEFVADDVILPILRLPLQGSTAANVQITVDPSDPDQIQVSNNSGTNIVTVGMQIVQHNNQTGSGCESGDVPSNDNAFPTTDTNGSAPNTPSSNWIFAINCGNPFCPAGWSTFSQLNILCRPSGDWNIRLTYEPLGNCGPGACCLSDGSCNIQTGPDCVNAGGVFQGTNILCTEPQVNCVPLGQCCTDLGDCFVLSEDGCAAVGNATWLGAGTDCAGPCVLEGACCFSDNSCAEPLLQGDCELFSGTFQGIGTNCNDIDCNPLGACCFSDGSCSDGLSPTDCETTFGGTYQGNDTTCGTVSCPQPTGACCSSTGGCALLLQSTCNGIPNATWMGPGTTCADGNMNGTADACETSMPGDTDGDGVVQVTDLVNVILAWGPCGDCPPFCPEDFDQDCDVDVADLVAVILNWTG